jgi:Predicted metal-dependent hydrolase
MQKTILHPKFGKILYTKRVRSKSIRISINPSTGIRVSLPYFTAFTVAQEFVNKNEDKIEKILKKQQQQNTSSLPDKTTLTPQQIALLRKKAKEILPQRLKLLSTELNNKFIIKNRFGFTKKDPFSYNRLALKNNKSNWGSCSSKKNINLNIHLVRIPQHLMDYVIIHELCHLVHPNHGQQFHELVNAACGGKEKEYIKELKGISITLISVPFN